jgi:exodeoxyribonuclease VII large subunit
MAASIDKSTQREIYSVSRLNREARTVLENEFPRLWVEGEISNLARPASGHLYFTLKDSSAQISCALFRNRAQQLRFSPENGARVLVRAQLSLYEPRGSYQLIVDSMEDAGDGVLQRAFEALKQKLFMEGLFDEKGKKPLPELPHRIGVITSPSGAAVRDVLTVLKRRFAGIPVTIYPTAVQGQDAGQQIVSALQLAQQDASCDVLLLTRGGGSLEDLWPFNEEAVARAVYDCTIPTISAVGHEIDMVITDFVADHRAATPSAAAELLSPDQTELANRVRLLRNRLAQQARQQLRQYREQLSWISGRLTQTHPGRQLQQQAQRLDELEQRLRRGWQHRQTLLHSTIEQLSGRILRYSPQTRLQQLRERCTNRLRQLHYCLGAQIAARQEKVGSLSRALHAVSPLATLQRGYSITIRCKDNRVLQQAEEVQADELLETRLAKGRLLSKVTEVKT